MLHVAKTSADPHASAQLHQYQRAGFSPNSYCITDGEQAQATVWSELLYDILYTTI